MSLFEVGLLATCAAGAAAQSGSVRGIVVDAGTREPIVNAVAALAGTTRPAFTDETGEFSFGDVEPGRYDLVIRHVAYGERSVSLTVTADPTYVLIALSATAIALEPVSVEVFTRADLQARGAGYRRNVVTREQIALAEGSNLTLADILRLNFPTVRVRRSEQIVGGDTCIELRSIRTMSQRSPCLSPAVFLDGVPITNPTSLYETLDPRVIDRMEVVPAAEAGARYGTGALYGALLIDTRRPGPEDTDARRRALATGPRSFDWKLDPRPHPGRRSFFFATVGNAVGLAAGVAIARECIGTRAPSNDRIVTSCDSWPTLGAAVAAVALPALGGALGSGLGGRTEASRGRIAPAAIGATMALVPGYAMLISSRRSDSASLYWLGASLLAIGSPLAAMVSDRLFRSLTSPGPH